METTRDHHPGRARTVSLLTTFAVIFALATGAVAMAATGYAHMMHAAHQLAPQSPATITIAPGCWQPPGCVFPAASAFPRQ